MGFFEKLFGQRKELRPVSEQAVIVQFQYGSTDLTRLFALEEQLEQAVSDRARRNASGKGGRPGA